jgi:hypothetical protein
MTNRPSASLVRLVAAVPAALLVVAVFPMPYGFYTLLRLVVTAAAVLIVWRELSGSQRPLWAVLMGLVALLFNPVVPVHLTREIWFFIDLAVAAIFAVYALTVARREER